MAEGAFLGSCAPGPRVCEPCEAGKFSKGNEALTGPAEALTAALAEAKEAAMDRVHEVLRAQVFVIVASHYGASAPDA